MIALVSLGGVFLALWWATDQLLKLHFLRQRPDLTAAVLGAKGYGLRALPAVSPRPGGHGRAPRDGFGALLADVNYLSTRKAVRTPESIT